MALRASLLLLKDFVSPSIDAELLRRVRENNFVRRSSENFHLYSQYKRIVRLKENIIELWRRYQEGLDEVQSDLILSKNEEKELRFLASSLGINLDRLGYGNAWFLDPRGSENYYREWMASYDMHSTSRGIS